MATASADHTQLEPHMHLPKQYLYRYKHPIF